MKKLKEGFCLALVLIATFYLVGSCSFRKGISAAPRHYYSLGYSAGIRTVIAAIEETVPDTIIRTTSTPSITLEAGTTLSNVIVIGIDEDMIYVKGDGATIKEGWFLTIDNVKCTEEKDRTEVPPPK